MGIYNYRYLKGLKKTSLAPQEKIRYLNGNQNYIYTATLDGSSMEDCSWLLIQFSKPVANIGFDLIDIDKASLNNWQDQLTITPKWDSIDAPIGILTNEENATITGSANCGSTSDNCNTFIHFDGPLTEIRINYCYGRDITASIPDRQIYNIGNISFDVATVETIVESNPSCPSEPYEISVQNAYIPLDHKLEYIVGDVNGIVIQQKIETKSGIYNGTLKSSKSQCGAFRSIVRVANQSIENAIIGNHINDYICDNECIQWVIEDEINDNTPPTIESHNKNTVYLYCNEEIPVPEYVMTYDDCTPSDKNISRYRRCHRLLCR